MRRHHEQFRSVIPDRSHARPREQSQWTGLEERYPGNDAATSLPTPDRRTHHQYCWQHKIFNNSPSSRSDGYDFLKGGSILFLVTAIGIALLILYLFTKLSSIASGESRLLYAAIVAVPFIAVRIVYTLIAVFTEYKGDFSAFSNSTDAVLVRGIMVVAMEVIVIIIYIAAGLTAQKLDKNAQKNRNAGMPPSEYQPQDQPQMAPTGNRY